MRSSWLSLRNLVLGYLSVMIIGLYWMFTSEPNCIVHNHARNPLDETEDCPRKQLSILQQQLSMKASQLQNTELKLTKIMRKLRRSHPYQQWNVILKSFESSLPMIYAITPTYARPTQKAELTRLAQTFLHIHNFHWMIVEDSSKLTPLVTDFLARSGLRYTHLNVATPMDYKLKQNDPNWLKPRGVLQRNLALEWLRTNLDQYDKGVVYFADDDNTYHLKLFDEMRNTHGVSVWPVGLVGGLMYEGPVVQHGKVVRWHAFWKPERPFAIDMAGFAINLQLILDNPSVQFSNSASRGYQESNFLKPLVSMDQLEPKAENCTKVLVWHTRTEKTKMKNEIKLKKLGKLPAQDIEV